MQSRHALIILHQARKVGWLSREGSRSAPWHDRRVAFRRLDRIFAGFPAIKRERQLSLALIEWTANHLFPLISASHWIGGFELDQWTFCGRSLDCLRLLRPRFRPTPVHPFSGVCVAQSDRNGQSCFGGIFLATSRRACPLALAIVRAELNHPALWRSRAPLATLPRKSAISTGPSENSPALAFAVKTRR